MRTVPLDTPSYETRKNGFLGHFVGGIFDLDVDHEPDVLTGLG
jgi:hypothetical protein